MPQRKSAKRAKSKKSVRRNSNSVSKRTGKQDVLGLVAKIESEFLHVPSRLVALCRQEQNTVKQRYNKTNVTLKKLQAKQTSLQKKLKTLSAQKKSKQNAKQLNVVKKAITQNSKLVKTITKQTAEINKISVTLAAKEAKFVALSKQLKQLDKQLKNKKIAKPVKAKVRKKSAAPKKSKQVFDIAQPSGDSLSTIYGYNTAPATSGNDIENN